MLNSQQRYRFESGWIVKLVAAIGIAGIVWLAVFAFATGNAVAVGTLILLIVAGATGLILERIDSGRSREPGDEGAKDDYWGFRGRPGA